MPFQYAPMSTFFPATVTASSSAVDYPPSMAAEWTSAHPVARAWHSTATTPQALIFDFGGVRSGTWVALLNANFTSVYLNIGDGTTFTPVGGSNPRTLTRDPADPEEYHKLFLAAAYSGSVGYIEIPAQATTDGLPYFRAGLVLWGSSLVTMTRHLQVPLAMEYTDPAYVVEGKDWESRYPAGLRSVTWPIKQNITLGEVGEWHALRRLRPGTRLLTYLNVNAPQQTYLCERSRAVTITRHGNHYEVTTALRILV